MKRSTLNTFQSLIDSLVKISSNLNSTNKTLYPKYSKEIDKQDSKTTLDVYYKLSSNFKKSKKNA